MEIIKPDKTAFLWYPIAKNVFGMIIVLLVFSALPSTFKIFGVIVAAVCFLYFLYNCIAQPFRYKKTSYLIDADTLKMTFGSIFSNGEIVLPAKNVTQVIHSLPFIKNLLFGIGHVVILSAGTGSGAIGIVYVKDSEEIYERVIKILQKNGFSVQRKKPLQQEHPNLIGVAMEVFGRVIRNLITVGFVLLYIFIESDFKMPSGIIMGIFLLLAIPLAIYFIVRSIFHFMDATKRTYNIYEDCVTYTEGFLTKHKAIIPFENISDTSLHQDFLSRLFGIYDIKISCQGAEQQIMFNNINNAKELEKNLDDLIDSYKPKKKGIVNAPRKIEKKVVPSKTVVSDQMYKMNALVALFPIILIAPIVIIISLISPLMIILLFAIIPQVVKVFSTRYYVRKSSVAEKYDFITRKNVEYSDDKVVSMMVEQRLIDRIFNTCSIKFWSIGSSEELIFSHVDKTDELLTSLYKKYGFTNEKVVHEIRPEFSFRQFLLATLPFTILSVVALLFLGIFYSINPAEGALSIIIAGFILLVYVGVAVIAPLYYKRAVTQYRESFIHAHFGLIRLVDYFLPLTGVKDIVVHKYPLSTRGSLFLNVAGERLVQTKNGKQSIKNTVMIPYIEDIFSVFDLTDMLLRGETRNTQKVTFTQTPMFANTALIVTIVSIVLFPFLLVLPISLGIAYAFVKARRYEIQTSRVVSYYGVVFKKRHSINFTKIDAASNVQSWDSKMFGNGKVVLFTAGSSVAEIIVSDIPEYMKFYEIVRKK